jgi:azurin
LFKVVILVACLLVFASLTFAACGGSSDSSASSTDSGPTPDTTQAKTEAAPEELLLDISVEGEDLEFDQEQMSAPAGQEVTVRFRNTSKAQPHNWVLVEDGTKDDVTADGIDAGEENDYIAPDDTRVLAQTGLLGAESTGRVVFTVPPAGAYQFVCTFPAHNITMFGTFTSTP